MNKTFNSLTKTLKVGPKPKCTSNTKQCSPARNFEQLGPPSKIISQFKPNPVHRLIPMQFRKAPAHLYSLAIGALPDINKDINNQITNSNKTLELGGYNTAMTTSTANHNITRT
jgi:hypothetical protein